ncbi:hypothetical protein IMZ48_35815 [Candidatus Bathyarchaeota archaeon]|nr:hypothetical protein [Candidatus Bathyarchaeota archaeon]
MPSCIYYRCSRVVWSEDTAFDRAPLMRHKNTGASAGIPVFRDQKMDPYVMYTTLFFRYGSRALTNEADALDAIAGLVNRIARTLSSDTVEGLLTTHFDLCLLFYNSSTQSNERRAEFPTWALVGWKGSAHMWNPSTDRLSTDRWLATERHIKWYRRDLRTGDLKLICEPSDGRTEATPDARLETEEKINYEEENSSGDEVEVTDGYENEKKKEREDGRGGRADEESADEGAADEARDGLSTNPTPIRWRDIPFEYPALQFWTWTVLLPRVVVTERGPGKVYSRLGLCGAVYFDDHRFGRDQARHYEAALLSRADSLDGRQFEVPARRPVWWVLLIDWKAEGLYAERTAVGFIYRSHVQHLVPGGRAWKEIVLV